MKRLMIAVAALLLSKAAFAADVLLPTKAPVYTPACQSAASCSGFYIDFGVIGSGGNADIIGNGLDNTLFQNGAGIVVGGGYQLWAGQLFAGVQVNAGYQFATSNGLGGHFTGTEVVQLGYNFFPQAGSSTTVAGQSPTLLTVPANLLASTTPYFNMGGCQVRGSSTGCFGGGLQTVIAAGWSSEVDYYSAPSINGQPASQIVSLKILKHF